MLYSALCNLEDQSDPYPTALAPGQRPISVDESRERRKAAAEQLSAQRAAEQQEVSSSGQVAGGRYTRSGQSYSRAAPLPAGALHLTCRLGSQVFLGRCAALPSSTCHTDLSTCLFQVVASWCNCKEVARAHAHCMNGEVCP